MQKASVEKDSQKAPGLSYMKKRRRKLYTACEELDFIWDRDEVKEFDYLWKEGHSLENISSYFSRDIDETAILLMDRVRRGFLEQRVQGIG